MKTLNKKEVKKVLESLQELSVDVEDYDFGPAYEMAKRRQKKAIKIMKKYLKEIKDKS